MRGRPRAGEERGETLLELLIAIAILGVCVVAIGSAIAGAVVVSGIHRQQSDAGAVLHNYAEQLEAATYANCASSYSLATQAGFTAPSVAVAYWNASAFQGTCPSGGDQGLQRVTVTINSADGRVSQSLRLVLRRTS